jgi:predicted Zn-dependent protease
MLMTEELTSAAQSDAELAAILGHELGHVIADHEKERFSTGRLVTRQMIPWLPVALPGAIMTGLGILAMEEMILVPGLFTAVLPSIPFVAYAYLKSRSQELEEDYIGLPLMTEAGYDPGAATSIHETAAKWQEEYFEALKKQYGVDKVHKRPDWLSTHPNVRSFGK